ncbi:MAG: hypothetical protein E7271_04850 [Lachnospiraceae bacterium]|jgi:hypothetical protein|nr:hypothetical protein [Lachnospiraceae bacterium]
MKRNIIFLIFAIMTGLLTLAGNFLHRFFYPQNYAKNELGEYVNITVSNQVSTFPVNKSTIFNVEYDYPEEDRLLKEQLKCIPALLGCDKDGVENYLSNYMDNLSQAEKEAGLCSYKMISYNGNEITLRKTFKKPEYNGYYAKSYNGLVVILKGDEKTVYDYTQISITDLPNDLQESVLKGYYLESDEELYSFLETYTS